jgi:hypothetical protein
MEAVLSVVPVLVLALVVVMKTFVDADEVEGQVLLVMQKEEKADAVRSPPLRRTVATRAAMRQDRAVMDLNDSDNMRLGLQTVEKLFPVDDNSNSNSNVLLNAVTIVTSCRRKQYSHRLRSLWCDGPQSSVD